MKTQKKFWRKICCLFLCVSLLFHGGNLERRGWSAAAAGEGISEASGDASGTVSGSDADTSSGTVTGGETAVPSGTATGGVVAAPSGTPTDGAVTVPSGTPTGAAVQTPAATDQTTASAVPVPSEPEESIVPLALGKPQKVKKIYFCARGTTKVKLSWSRSENADKYRIYRKKTGTGSYQKIGQTRKTKLIDKKVRFAKSYMYKIVAVRTENGQVLVSKPAKALFQNIHYVSMSHQKYAYTEMEADIKGLERKYHGIFHAKVIGKSEDNRKIYDVILGNPNAKKSLLVVSNLHAREYVTSMICMSQAEYYLEHYGSVMSGKKISKVLNKIAIHFIPMANPDGTTISQFGISSIRSASLRSPLYQLNKHGTTTWKANARGVDLNRNYPIRFRIQGHRSSEGYSGPYAASESETRAIIKITTELKKKHGLQGVVNYHSMGSIVFGGCSLGGSISRNTARMYSLARGITGYASSAGYKSSSRGDGNYREYLIYKIHVPSITLEVGRIPAPGPAYEYPSIWRRNYSVVMREAMLFV